MRVTEAFQWLCGAQGDHFSSLAKHTQPPLALVQLEQLSPFVRENSALSKLPFLPAPSIQHIRVTSPNLNSFSIRRYQKYKPQYLNYWVVRSLGCRVLFLVYLAVAGFSRWKDDATKHSTYLSSWISVVMSLAEYSLWIDQHILLLCLTQIVSGSCCLSTCWFTNW